MSTIFILQRMIKEFHHTEFLPIERVVAAKQAGGHHISLVIPTLNEAHNIQAVVSSARQLCMERHALLDEIIVVDSLSHDATCQLARSAGATVFTVDTILPETVFPRGKGCALWKSLSVASGDIIVCVDADILDFDARFIYGLVAPLVLHSHLLFVKAFYGRPRSIDSQVFPNYGGRVTEIMVRPLLSAFFPELARFRQPLSGEYAFRADCAKSVAFSSGYGVEMALLFNIYKKYGSAVFAQVDVDSRSHRNRPTVELGWMAFEILQVFGRNLKREGMVEFKQACHSHMIAPHGHDWTETLVKEIEIPALREYLNINKA